MVGSRSGSNIGTDHHNQRGRQLHREINERKRTLMQIYSHSSPSKWKLRNPFWVSNPFIFGSELLENQILICIPTRYAHLPQEYVALPQTYFLCSIFFFFFLINLSTWLMLLDILFSGYLWKIVWLLCYFLKLSSLLQINPGLANTEEIGRCSSHL